MKDKHKNIIEKLFPAPHGFKLIEIKNNVCTYMKIEDYERIVTQTPNNT